MSRWTAELEAPGVPRAADIAAELSPPAVMVYMAELTMTAGIMWGALCDAITEAGHEPPEWINVGLGAIADVADNLAELLVYLDAHVPSDSGNGSKPEPMLTVPGFCNDRPPGGNGAGCLGATGHSALEGTEHNNGAEQWPAVWPKEAEPDPEFECVICHHDASDPHKHESEHGHWPEYKD